MPKGRTPVVTSSRASDSLVEYLRERVQEAVGGWAGVTRKRMLVSDGWMVKGKVFTLVNRQGRIVVRLVEKGAQDDLLAIDGASPWQFGKKPPMRSWLQLPESMHDDAEALTIWLKRAWSQVPAPTAKRAAKTKVPARSAKTPPKRPRPKK